MPWALMDLMRGAEAKASEEREDGEASRPGTPSGTPAARGARGQGHRPAARRQTRPGVGSAGWGGRQTREPAWSWGGGAAGAPGSRAAGVRSAGKRAPVGFTGNAPDRIPDQ